MSRTDEYPTGEARHSDTDPGNGYPSFPSPGDHALHLPGMGGAGLRSPSDEHAGRPHGHAGVDTRSPGRGGLSSTTGGQLNRGTRSTALARAKDTLLGGHKVSYDSPGESAIHAPEGGRFKLLHSPSDQRHGPAKSNAGTRGGGKSGSNFDFGGHPRGGSAADNY